MDAAAMHKSIKEATHIAVARTYSFRLCAQRTDGAGLRLTDLSAVPIVHTASLRTQRFNQNL